MEKKVQEEGFWQKSDASQIMKKFNDKKSFIENWEKLKNMVLTVF